MCCLQSDPDNQKKVEFDWWSKYYYSIDDQRRTQQEYVDQGYDKMKVGAAVLYIVPGVCVCTRACGGTVHHVHVYTVLVSIQMYPVDLEESFGKFEDLAQTFLLYRGKGSRDPDELEGESVGLLKACRHYSLLFRGYFPPPLPPSLPPPSSLTAGLSEGVPAAR